MDRPISRTQPIVHVSVYVHVYVFLSFKLNHSSPQVDGTFTVDTLTGAVRVGRPLDFDTTDSYSVRVTAEVRIGNIYN